LRTSASSAWNPICARCIVLARLAIVRHRPGDPCDRRGAYVPHPRTVCCRVHDRLQANPGPEGHVLQDEECVATYRGDDVPERKVLYEDKEPTMHSSMTLIDPIRADRRYGCRGGEIATNMQRRKIPGC
jgi:hypothetical protein